MLTRVPSIAEPDAAMGETPTSRAIAPIAPICQIFPGR
jgi:hypothetical protein